MRAALRRLSQMLALLVGLSVLLFGLLAAMPGDPIDLLITSNPSVKPEDVIRLKKLRGLDRPWYVRYVRWVWGYHNPRRPPAFAGLPAEVVQLDDDGVASVDVDLAPALSDPDHRPSLSELQQAVRSADIDGAAEIARRFEEAVGEGSTEAAEEWLRTQAPAAWAAVLRELRLRSAAALRLEGRFGAVVESLRLRAEVRGPGVHRVWFVATDADGLATAGAVTVLAAPAPPPPPPPLEEGVPPEGTPDEQRALAGGTEEPEPAVPTEEELAEQARQAPMRLLFKPPRAHVVDDPATFSVDLQALLAVPTDAPPPRFEILPGSPGELEGSEWRHTFPGPGQTVVEVAARSGDQVAHGLLTVEHGPLPDPERFVRGFVFALLGDREALGFSNTYKRPVGDILFGPEEVCGDLLVGPSESCDDGNQTPGDGCSATCHDEALTFWGRLDVEAAGLLLGSGRILNTLSLMLPALLLSLLLALPIGILAATRQYSWLDYLVNFLAFVGISLPVFWFGIMIMALVAEKLQWLPAGGIQTPGLRGTFLEVLADRLRYTTLPALVLSVAYTGRWLRYMRAAMLEVLPLDFVRTARAKGLPERLVILKHALKNALIPVVTVLALSIPSLFGGAVLTEWVFSWPGIGRLQYDAVMSNDSYLAIVVFLILAALVMVGNLLADLLYALLDPRLRREGP